MGKVAAVQQKIILWLFASKMKGIKLQENPWNVHEIVDWPLTTSRLMNTWPHGWKKSPAMQRLNLVLVIIDKTKAHPPFNGCHLAQG